jgi:hypothetical protein
VQAAPIAPPPAPPLPPQPVNVQPAVPIPPQPVPPAPVQAAPVLPPPIKVNPQPTYTSVPSQPLPPVITTTKSSGVGKTLLWVGLILFVLFAAIFGTTLYGYFWVKHKVTSYASHITGQSDGPMKVVDHGDSCRLLSAADVQKILGVAVEKTAEIEEGEDPGCAYFTNPAALAQLQRTAMAQAKKQQAAQAAKKSGSGADNPLAMLKDTNQMEGLFKGLTESGGSAPGKAFSFTVQRNFSESSWSGMRLVESAVPGFEEISGVGDHAMVGSFGHVFYAIKGETMVRLDTTLVPEPRTRGAQLSRKILGNL